MVLVSPADHAQHAKERAQDDMGEQFAAKQFMERHDSVTQSVMDKQDRSSADEYLRELPYCPRQGDLHTLILGVRCTVLVATCVIWRMSRVVCVCNFRNNLRCGGRPAWSHRVFQPLWC